MKTELDYRRALKMSDIEELVEAIRSEMRMSIKAALRAKMSRQTEWSYFDDGLQEAVDIIEAL